MRSLGRTEPEEMGEIIERSLVSFFSCAGGHHKHSRYSRLLASEGTLLRCMTCGKQVQWQCMQACYVINGYRAGRSHVSMKQKSLAVALLLETLLGIEEETAVTLASRMNRMEA